MSEADAELSPKQFKAVMVLSTGASNERCAEMVGVRPSTVSGWLRSETFRAELRRQMERMRQVFESRVVAQASNAMGVIQEMLKNEDLEIKADGARIAISAAVKLSNRYKEMTIEGYVPPPMFVLPEGTKISTVVAMPEPPDNARPMLPRGPVVETTATEIEEEEADDED